MIRITGGLWRGRKLRTPEGDATRPTPAMVRAALFNILGDTVMGCVFCDLYAGSGVIGIEALSRGAARAVFVETAHRPLACLRANLEMLGCPDAAHSRAPRTSPAQCFARRLPGWLTTPEFLQTVDSPDAPVVIFLDPPYRENLAAETLDALALGPNPPLDAVCVAQTEKEAQMPQAKGAWALRRRYPYGDTALWVYGPGENQENR